MWDKTEMTFKWYKRCEIWGLIFSNSAEITHTFMACLNRNEFNKRVSGVSQLGLRNKYEIQRQKVFC